MLEVLERLLQLIEPVNRHVIHDEIELALLELVKPLSFFVYDDRNHLVRDISLGPLKEPILYPLSDDVIRFL